MKCTEKIGPDRYMGPSARSIAAYSLALRVADWYVNRRKTQMYYA